MRVLIISNLLPPRMKGGFELACYNISKGLRAKGHDVLVLTSPTDLEPTEPQPFVQRTLSLNWFQSVNPTGSGARRGLVYQSQVSHWGNTLIVLQAIRDFKPDHVMMFGLVGLGGLAIIDAVDRSGVGWTMNLGDSVPSALVEGIPTAVLDVYDAGPEGTLFSRGRYSAVSQTLVDEITDSGVDLGDDITIIPRGVIIADVPRTREYLAGGQARFVSAGILRPHKGIDLIVEAAGELVRGGTRNFHIDVYGGGDPEPYRDRCEALGVADRVTFHGPVTQPEVIAANAGADAFLFPTWSREPGASAPVEAGVAGATTIMTADCGPAERMADGVHCLKIERTVPDLVDAMRRVCNGEVDLEAIGAAARRLAAGDLSFDTAMERIEAVLARPWDGPAVDLASREIDTDALLRDRTALSALNRTFEGN